MSAARELPEARLDARASAMLEASIIGDIALRTALATLLGSALAGGALRADRREERRRLEFYARLAEEGDAESVFRRPPARVKMAARDGGPLGLPGGRIELLSFRSPYRAVNPAARGDYDREGANRTAVAEHWRHESGPRPTLAVIHGFGASPVWLNTAFFSLREFFAEGWDVLLYTLPFHGSRRSRTLAFNGIEMFSGGIAQTHEALIHAVFDFRVLLSHLLRQGVPRAGVTGLSLGGYVSGLLAAAEPRLDFVVPNSPVVWIPSLMAGWTPANMVVGLAQRVLGVPDDLLMRALSVHSPLSYAPRLARERLMIVCGMGDRLAPPEQGVLLWQHWGRPELHWFAGSHVLHFGRAAYLARMRELMARGG